MSKLSLLKFVAQPREVAEGVRRLGAKGAVLHGVRRMSAAMERAVLGPAQLRISPMGAMCNHSCGMCWLQHLPPGEKEHQFQGDRDAGMSLDEYRALFDGMPAGLTEVNIVGGGEPLVHRECTEIMREVKRRKVRGYLMTNGTLMKERISRAMVDMRWDLTRFSCHAGDADTFRAVHGVDHFERLRGYIQTFDKQRREAGRQKACGIHIHNVIQRENLDTIPLMFEFAESVGADHMVFEIVFALSPEIRLTVDELGRAANQLESCARDATTASNADHIVALLRREQGEAPREPLPRPAPVAAPPPPRAAPPEPVVQPAATNAASVEATTMGAAEPPPGSNHTEPPYRPANRCSVGFDSAMVNAQGWVQPCCFSTEIMGSVRQQTFREIWFGEKYENFRQRLIRGQFAEYCSRVRCKLKSFLHD